MNLNSGKLVLRVRLNYDMSNHTHVMTLGGELLERTSSSQFDGIYNRFEDLPEWIQGAISVLSILEKTGINTSEGPEIKGVGQRLTENIFWLALPEEYLTCN